MFYIWRLQIPIHSTGDIGYTVFVDNIGKNHILWQASLFILDEISTVEQSVNFLFPQTILDNPLVALKRVFLSSLNKPIDDFNDCVFEHLQKIECLCPNVCQLVMLIILKDNYYNANFIKKDSDSPKDDVTPNFLAILTHNSVPPHHLCLKKGCVCSLVQNLSIWKGLVKNTCVIVHQLHCWFIKVQVINNYSNSLGELHCIPRIWFEFSPAHAS